MALVERTPELIRARSQRIKVKPRPCARLEKLQRYELPYQGPLVQLRLDLRPCVQLALEVGGHEGTRLLRAPIHRYAWNRAKHEFRLSLDHEWTGGRLKLTSPKRVSLETTVRRFKRTAWQYAHEIAHELLIG